MAKRLARGTVCMVCSPICSAHNGKVVVVQGYDHEAGSYDCLPQLTDPRDGVDLAWFRTSLIPFKGALVEKRKVGQLAELIGDLDAAQKAWVN